VLITDYKPDIIVRQKLTYFGSEMTFKSMQQHYAKLRHSNDIDIISSDTVLITEHTIHLMRGHKLVCFTMKISLF
jgi:hypothetical protein